MTKKSKCTYFSEKKYDTIDALIAQMHKDREKTAKILL